jgi:Uma2 family endonuclease
MPTDEIVLPITKPESEWLLGHAVRKVSPTRRHSLLQTAFYRRLDDWAAGRGEVGTEWRFRLQPPGEIRRPLVPDVAFVWNERLRGLTLDEADLPDFAPDVVVEILSKDDRAVYVDEKIDVYRACGCPLIVIVNPFKRLVSLVDRTSLQIFHDGETITHTTLPGFELGVTDLFSVMELPQ